MPNYTSSLLDRQTDRQKVTDLSDITYRQDLISNAGVSLFLCLETMNKVLYCVLEWGTVARMM